MDVHVLKQEIADHQTCLDELVTCKNELAIANEKLELVSKKYNVNLSDNSFSLESLMKIEEKPLKKLAVCIEDLEKEDVVVIFAEPCVKDLKELMRDESVLNLVNDVLFNRKEDLEDKRKDALEHKENEFQKRDNIVIKKEVEEKDKLQVKNIRYDSEEEIMNEDCKEEVVDNIELQEYIDTDSAKKSKLKKIKPVLNKEKPVEDITNKQEKFECDICGKRLSHFRTLQKHKLIHEDRFFPCKSCEMTFKNYKDLRRHGKVHKDDSKVEKLYTCDICGKTCNFKSQFIEHQRSHTGEKPFVCDVCGKSCFTKGDLKKHKVYHTGIRPYACKQCDMKFYHKYTLGRHEETHQSERPTFQCTICKKELILSQKTSIRRHMKLHESVKPHDGVKPHVCNICGKSFNEKIRLVGHLRNHTGEKPYSCDLCDKSFSLSDGLKKHKIMHTGNKSFSCEVCNKKFFQKTFLERHMRVHTGEKPYSCELCGKTFAFPSNLKRHKKTHSGLEPKTSVND